MDLNKKEIETILLHSGSKTLANYNKWDFKFLRIEQLKLIKKQEFLIRSKFGSEADSYNMVHYMIDPQLKLKINSYDEILCRSLYHYNGNEYSIILPLLN